MIRWIAEHHERGVLNGRIGRDGDDLVAEWLNIARLAARRDGTDVRFEPASGADPEQVEKIRRGSAQLLLRHLQGKTGLHGAAFGVAGKAVVLFGAADAGKSTLAAAACAKAGAVLLADDAVALEGSYEVLGLERDHWLDVASRRALGMDASGLDDKVAVASPSAHALEAAGATKVPLAALVQLSFADVPAPRLTALGGVEAIAVLIPQVVRFIVDEPALQRTELDALAELVARVPLYRLERPRDLAQLDATTSIVVGLASRGES